MSTPPPERVCGDLGGLDEEAPWPMDGACPTRIGRAKGALTSFGASIAPVYGASTDQETSGGALVDADGNVYVMTRRLKPAEGGNPAINAAVLRVFDDKSAPAWELAMPNEVPGSAVLTRFGGVPSVLVATAFQVRLVDRETHDVIGGAASAGGFIAGSPVVSGGTVFFANALGELHAWRPEGVPVGDDHVVYADGEPNNAALLSPAVGADGTIYFTKMLPNQTGGFLHAVTLEQNPLRLTKKWAVPFVDFVYGGQAAHLSVASDGTIVFATTKALLGFTPEGDPAFSVAAQVGPAGPTIVGNRVFYPGTSGTLLSVDTKGKKIYESPAGFATSFLATAEGLVTYTTLSPTRRLQTIDWANGTSVHDFDTSTFDTSASLLSLDAKGRPLLTLAQKVTAYGSP